MRNIQNYYFSILCLTVLSVITNGLLLQPQRPLTPAPRRLSTICLSQENDNNNIISSSSVDSTAAAAASNAIGSPSDVASSGPSWTEKLDSKLLEEVRLELIAKYLERGITEEEAQNEVDAFLADQERAEQYLEMRMYASAQADDLGLGLIVQLGGGFLIGFLISVGPKYFHVFQEAANQ